MTALWKQLGLADAVTLQLNSLGPAKRARHRDALRPTRSSVSIS